MISWHNTFFHSHQGTVKEEFAVVHKHDHGHQNSGHHHGESKLALWDWVKQILGDFEHPDLGENHFELFLNPGNQIVLDQPSAIVFQPFIIPEYPQFSDLDTYQNNNAPIKVLSLSGPPFFDSLSNRGPPTFS
ncbi:MAG: hypothetical protein H6566_29015 [Lewinellaceae bacterium]|nr:hypothetical protein [Lewinellaceae bacterium]